MIEACQMFDAWTFGKVILDFLRKTKLHARHKLTNDKKLVQSGENYLFN